MHLRISAMMLANAYINSEEQLEERIKARQEFLSLGFLEVLKVIEKQLTSHQLFPELVNEIQTFREDMEADRKSQDQIMETLEIDINDPVAVTKQISHILGKQPNPKEGKAPLESFVDTLKVNTTKILLQSFFFHSESCVDLFGWMPEGRELYGVEECGEFSEAAPVWLI